MPKLLSEYYLLGYVSRTHGLRGQVVVKLDVDDPSSYQKLKHIFLGKELTKYQVTKAVIRNDTALLLLAGIDSIDQAETLVGKEAYLPLAELPPLDDRTLYLHEAIGMEVVEETAGSLGPVVTVYDSPVQPVGAVMVNGNEVLFPLLRKFIKHVDRENNRLHMIFPDGLIDVYSDTDS
jgi:16S rRNA processing protein RimM